MTYSIYPIRLLSVCSRANKTKDHLHAKVRLIYILIFFPFYFSFLLVLFVCFYFCCCCFLASVVACVFFNFPRRLTRSANFIFILHFAFCQGLLFLYIFSLCLWAWQIHTPISIWHNNNNSSSIGQKVNKLIANFGAWRKLMRN